MTFPEVSTGVNAIPSNIIDAVELNERFTNIRDIFGVSGYYGKGWIPVEPSGGFEFHATNAIKTISDINLTGDLRIGDKITWTHNPTGGDRFGIITLINHNSTVANRTYIEIFGSTALDESVVANTVGVSRMTNPIGWSDTIDFLDLESQGWTHVRKIPTRTATDTIGGSGGQNTTYVATLTFSGIDISGTMTEGVKIRYSQDGSTKYAFVMANSTLSEGNTIVNIFGGTDFQCLDTSSNPITNVSISRDKCPAGFPMNPGKWNIVFKHSSTLERTTNDWGTVANFILAAGNWNMYASGQLHTSRASGRTRTAVTISKISDGEDDPELTSMIRLESGGDLSLPFHTQKNMLVEEKTTFHINLWAQDSSTTSQLQGFGKPTLISIYPVSL